MTALVGLVGGAAVGSVAPAQAGHPPTRRPTLLVQLVVDQMRADYVDWYGRQWTHGLRRLIDGGARFTNAAYPYLITVTCAGHATIGTGALPWKHGMVLNAWFDRGLGTTVPCTQDPEAPLVSYGAPGKGGHSAHFLAVPTLGDELRTRGGSTPGRVVSMSMKPRSAIMLAGHGGDVVTWMENGTWVTSRAFASAPIPWVARWAKANQPRPQAEGPWTRLLPASRYVGMDDVAAEQPPPGWGRTFPHAFAGPLLLTTPVEGAPRKGTPDPPTLWQGSPASDRALGLLAQTAVREMSLGKGKSTDLLSISFSALDGVGHAYGPRSHEIQDVLARLDVVLGDLLDALDRHVGRGRYLLALSADHGVAEYPEALATAGTDAGRVSMAEVKQRVEAAIARRLGPGPSVASVQYTDVYLLRGIADRLRAQPGAMQDVLAAMHHIPGVEAAFSSDQLRSNEAQGDNPLRAAAARSHFPARSGDLVILPRPNWITVSEATTHGSHHSYDRSVPLILYGAGVRRGVYDRPVSPADLAPTLAQAVGITMPQAEGQPLNEAFAGGASAAK